MACRRRKFPLEGEGVNEEKLAQDAWEEMKSKLERMELKRGKNGRRGGQVVEVVVEWRKKRRKRSNSMYQGRRCIPAGQQSTASTWWRKENFLSPSTEFR